MIQGIVSALLTTAVVSLLAYLTLLLSRSIGSVGDCFTQLVWLIEKTPALFAAALVAVIAAIAEKSGLIQVSNHIIISLDIIFIFSSLMLILFHQLKESIILSSI